MFNGSLVLLQCYMHRHGGHIGCLAALPDTSLTLDVIEVIQSQFGKNRPGGFRTEDLKRIRRALSDDKGHVSQNL